MFCTRCGTQINEGDNFCKNCGASTAKPTQTAPNLAAPDPEAIASPSPIETVPHQRPAQPSASQSRTIPASQLRQPRGINNSVVAGAAVVVIAAAGLYFGTDLFRKPVSDIPPPARESMAKVAEPSPPPPVEQAKIDDLPAESNLNSPLWSALTPEAAAPVEAPTAKPDALAKPVPKAQPAARTRKSPSQALAGRGNKAPGPSIASGRPAHPGTYETIRPTTLFEKPSGSSKAVSNIGDGTKVNVVGFSGNWLEVRSRLGNPPGFIRRDDAKPVESTD
jgi:hypothetical protein